MKIWSATDARRRFRELIDRAQTEGPQIITRSGRKEAAVLSHDTYLKLRPAKDFKTHLLSGPKVDDFEVERQMDLPRT